MFDLGRTFVQAVERDPDGLAMVTADRRLSYAALAQEVGAIQSYLQRAGLRRGDRVLTVLQNRVESAVIHWACQVSGITVVPVNWRSKAEEIDFFLENSEAKFVVFEQISAENVAGASRRGALGSLWCGEAQGVPASGDRFSEVVGHGADPVVHSHPDDWSVMLYTSGTTGKPKGVPRRQRAERAAALAHVAQNQYRMHEVTVGVMPLYHTMGVRTLISLALINGTFVAFPRWNAELFIDTIEREKATHLYLVPTLYHDMLTAKGFSPQRVASVSKLGFAGAPMHDALLLKLQAAFKPELFVNHYGSSEIYTYAVNQDAVKKPGSAGRAGLNARLRVVPFDQPGRLASHHEQCAQGDEGQIICDVQSDEAFEGYWKRPEVDQKSLRDGWFFTGDTGYVDQAGEFYVTGRVDDMIISGGENISPVEIESILSLHASVSEVAVCGLRDERLGQKVVAFVRPSEAVSADDLDRHCQASELMNFKRPREYVFVREIPKSPVGKVLRRELVAGNYDVMQQQEESK